MGTRADFYIGRGKEAKWLGSIAWDGYPDGIDAELLKAKSAAQFKRRTTRFLKSRKDATFPENGWPWPWDDSNTTDYAYCFDAGRVWYWEEPDDDSGACWVSGRAKDKKTPCDFPNMKEFQNVTLGPRSGVIVVG